MHLLYRRSGAASKDDNTQIVGPIFALIAIVRDVRPLCPTGDSICSPPHALRSTLTAIACRVRACLLCVQWFTGLFAFDDMLPKLGRAIVDMFVCSARKDGYDSNSLRSNACVLFGLGLTLTGMIVCESLTPTETITLQLVLSLLVFVAAVAPAMRGHYTFWIAVCTRHDMTLIQLLLLLSPLSPPLPPLPRLISFACVCIIVIFYDGVYRFFGSVHCNTKLSVNHLHQRSALSELYSPLWDW